jgi:hypothetical protein
MGTINLPFIHMLDAERRITAKVHINLGPKGNRDFKHCVFCLREKLLQCGTRLCDGQVARGTCDVPMCEFHSVHVGKDQDFCPNHKAQAPRTLFDEVRL